MDNIKFKKMAFLNEIFSGFKIKKSFYTISESDIKNTFYKTKFFTLE